MRVTSGTQLISLPTLPHLDAVEWRAGVRVRHQSVCRALNLVSFPLRPQASATQTVDNVAVGGGVRGRGGAGRGLRTLGLGVGGGVVTGVGLAPPVLGAHVGGGLFGPVLNTEKIDDK